MKQAKKTYEPPAMTKVSFKDKELVAFNVCKKATLTGNGGCCMWQPFNQKNDTNFDPS